MRISGIASRLYGLVGLGTAGLIVLTVVAAFDLRASLMDERISQTRQMDEAAVSAVEALYKRSQAGEMSEAAAMDAAKKLLRGLRYGNQEYFFVYDYNNVNVVHGRDPTKEGQSFADFADPKGKKYVGMLVSKARAGGGSEDYWSPRLGTDAILRKVSYGIAFAPWSWVVGTGVYVDDIDRQFRAMLVKLGIAVAVICVAIALLASVIAGSVARGIGSLRDNMSSMANGDLDLAIDAAQRGDEIGEMAQTLEGFRQALKQARQTELDRKRFQEDARLQQVKATAHMADKFEGSSGVMVQNVRGAANDLEKTATVMGQLMDETTRRTSVVDTASSRANENVSTVAAATEQLAASIGEISQLVQRSMQGAHEAVDKAKDSNKLIQSLADAALQINDVVQLITDIASQTNLLALNATIEAARAGDAGKGFAVVANEVKNLATATARATGDITAQIKAVQDGSTAAAKAIQEIVAAIDNISATATAVSAAVEQQDAATKDIARNIQMASGSTAEVLDNVGGLLDIAGRTGQSTKVLVVSAHIMAGLANELDGAVKEFGEFVRKQ